jgi:hypothetical protein
MGLEFSLKNITMIISITSTETIEKDVEYDLDVSKLSKDEQQELFIDLSQIVPKDCVEVALQGPFFDMVHQCGHPYIHNPLAREIAMLVDSDLSDDELKDLIDYIKKEYKI